MYVTNRIARILNVTGTNQWSHLETDHNPADRGTRSLACDKLTESLWSKGPNVLYQRTLLEPKLPSGPRPVDPEVRTANTDCEQSLGTSRFARFSKWHSAARAVAQMTRLAQRFHVPTEQRSKPCFSKVTAPGIRGARIKLCAFPQADRFSSEIHQITNNLKINKDSDLYPLNPFIDNQRLLRIGGRLKMAEICDEKKYRTIMPKNHHLTFLLIMHYHESIHHQRRHLTHATIQDAGYWILGAKRYISRIIFKCVLCRKLRGPFLTQQMSDLPLERVKPSAPFTHVVVDVWGHWNVSVRKTRAGSVIAKRWCVIFADLYTRGIHLEIIEKMSTSSFLNALRRFMAIRGPVQCLYSDCGSNFVGARNEFLVMRDSNETVDLLARTDLNGNSTPQTPRIFAGISSA